MQAVATLRAAVQAPPSKSTLTPKQLSAIEKFSQEPTAATADASYAPQSATVQGILKDMYDTFATDLESQTETEATKQRDFEDFIAVKVKELKHMESEIARKEEEKA